MRSGQTLLLHDLLFALDIRRNLVSTLFLIKNEFELRFCQPVVNLSLGQHFYGSGYFLMDL